MQEECSNLVVGVLGRYLMQLCDRAVSVTEAVMRQSA
jgi:hypothetical protein